ncbi:urease accessory protein UreD [Arthrobacter crystallopoietes BAB-32]|uniref:Urease accessory protein UreD n=1 Tax=Arthrobacter crystallopoietes BAB-32 TaxID=1246476 RepID=N1V1I2_9MICC|nr:urease accessory protein UreD [Arthrobacter crystallopoietes]EMY33844.1 urease accessory protein UreD [Arthrobacter crystallopoietes BAB-32]
MTAAQPADPQQPTGELRLTVGQRGGRGIATSQYHQGALRVIRPHYLDGTGQVAYTIVNPGGGYLGGDVYDVDIQVEDHARLLLTTQSATKIYRTPGDPAVQHTRFRLGPGASLEYVPDQLIAYRDATYRQDTVVELAADSSLVMCDVVTPGWSPDGQQFRYEEVRIRNDIYRDGRLLALDNLLIRPGDPDAPLSGMLFLEDYSHLGSMLVVDPRVDADLVRELQDLLAPLDPGGQLGISLLNGPGFALRALSRSTDTLNTLLHAAIDLLRHRWFGQQPLNLRKY